MDIAPRSRCVTRNIVERISIQVRSSMFGPCSPQVSSSQPCHDPRRIRVHYDPPVDHWKLRSFAAQEREIYGEQAYEERERVWERASQPLVPSRFPSHDKPQRRGPERGGPERDYGSSR